MNGMMGVTFVFTNISGQTCTLYGYPGLQLTDASRQFITTNVVRGGVYNTVDPGPTTVALSPGGSASFGASFADSPVGNETCPTSTFTELTPPNQVNYSFIPAQLAPCNNGTINVTAVEAGTTGPPAG